VLRGNLSTRPFYNERLVSLALLVVAVCAAVLTGYNATRLLSLSSQRASLKERIDRDQAEASRIRAQTAGISKAINGPMLSGLAGSTREANDIIDRRTFSWTMFFDLIEKMMPFDVRLEAVTPRIEKGVFKVAMTIVARRAPDVDDFIEALLATKAFRAVVPTDQSVREDGSYTALVEADYVAPRPPTPVEAPGAGVTPSSAGRKGGGPK
jgi:hypothetical protein